MLRYLIERYLDNLKTERSFDSMFLALLASEGYEDIHFTHGAIEFGKDFIAKGYEGAEQIQYAFQNKVGKVGAADWREIRHQMLETLTNNIGGPAFDAKLARRSVLVLTGRLVGTAPADYEQFVEFVHGKISGCTVLPPWDRETLIELLLKHGPETLFRTGADIASYGAFYRLYGDIVDHRAKTDYVERHFDDRLRAVADPTDRLAAVIIEAHLYADAARSTEQPYIALQSMMAVVRAIAFEIQLNGAVTSELSSLLRSAEADVYDAAHNLSTVFFQRASVQGSLFDAAGGAALVVTYPVLCTHLMDALVLQYFIGTDQEAQEASDFLANLVSSEPGCGRPISDRYAVSTIMAIRVLHNSGHGIEARMLLKDASIWLIDRYWARGVGLAPCGAQESDEIAHLVGGAFVGIDVKRQVGSLLACALMDAACFVQDAEIFNGLRADILAADIVPRYYQIRDTSGQFEYEAKDVVQFPNVEFADFMTPFEKHEHGNHLDGEPDLRLARTLGNAVYVSTSLLMRDRYFSQTWTMERRVI